MNDTRRKIMNIRASLAQVDWDLQQLSNRLARISGCSLNRVVEYLERTIARAQGQRLFLEVMLRHIEAV
jgi:hypothetical protein